MIRLPLYLHRGEEITSPGRVETAPKLPTIPGMQSERLELRISPELAELLRRMAKARRMPLRELVREALAELVGRPDLVAVKSIGRPKRLANN